LTRAAGSGETISHRHLARRFREPGLVQSIFNTGKVVVVTTAISFPIAVLISWVLARTDIPGSQWLEFGFWILFFLPALGTTTGWLLLFDPS
jgi:iron(III) transport system permease protein